MEVGEGLHVEVTGAIEPFLMLLGSQCADQTQATGFVGKDADDLRAALEFLVEAFEQVGALEMFVMALRQAVKGEGFLDLRFDPSGQFRVFGRPAFEPGGEVLAGFGAVAPIVEPTQFGQAVVATFARQMVERMRPPERLWTPFGGSSDPGA